MKVSVNTVDQAVVMSHAILIYKSPGLRHSGANGSFATCHDVSNVGTPDAPKFQIMPGSPLSKDKLLSTLGSVASRFTTEIDLIPENVLSHSPRHLMWWMPACNRRVFIRNKELGTRTAIVPHPPLLFIVEGGGWRVFALEENKRPQANSVLFHAPYFNIYDTGQICIGSAAVPDKYSLASITEWENAFFNSSFSHINGSKRRSKHPRGEYALWKELLDGAYSTYPTEYLAATTHTPKSILESLKRRLNNG